jgi:hypothetical protein
VGWPGHTAPQVQGINTTDAALNWFRPKDRHCYSDSLQMKATVGAVIYNGNLTGFISGIRVPAYVLQPGKVRLIYLNLRQLVILHQETMLF